MTNLTSNRIGVGANDLREIASYLGKSQHDRAFKKIESLTNGADRVVRVSGEDLAGPDLAEFQDAAFDALIRLRAEDYSGAKWQVLMLGDLVGVELDSTAGVTRT